MIIPLLQKEVMESFYKQWFSECVKFEVALADPFLSERDRKIYQEQYDENKRRLAIFEKIAKERGVFEI